MLIRYVHQVLEIDFLITLSDITALYIVVSTLLSHKSKLIKEWYGNMNKVTMTVQEKR